MQQCQGSLDPQIGGDLKQPNSAYPAATRVKSRYVGLPSRLIGLPPTPKVRVQQNRSTLLVCVLDGRIDDARHVR